MPGYPSRVCWTLAGGAIAIVVIVACVQALLCDAVLWKVTLILVAATLSPLALHLVFSIFRARVDHEGVHYRGLLGWTLWSWVEFESGHVHQAPRSVSFVNPNRPFLRRRLPVGAFVDGLTLLEACSEHWKPPCVIVPETLRVDVPVGSRAIRLGFSAHGVQVTERGKSTLYGWQDVLEITTERGTRYRQDFNKAIVRMSGRTLTIGPWRGRPGDFARRWRGPEARVIEAFLRRHVDESRFRDETADCLRTKMLRVEKLRQTHTSMGGRAMPFLIGLFTGGLTTGAAGSIVMMLSELGKKGSMVTGLAVGIPVGILAYVLGERERREMAQVLEAYRAELAAPADHEQTRARDGERCD